MAAGNLIPLFAPNGNSLRLHDTYSLMLWGRGGTVQYPGEA